MKIMLKISHLKHLLLFEICTTREMCEKFVYKHSETIEYVKNQPNLQTSRANNLIIFWIQNAKFSGYCFYMNRNIQRDFQICISVPLSPMYSPDLSLFSVQNCYTILIQLLYHDFRQVFDLNPIFSSNLRQRSNQIIFNDFLVDCLLTSIV